MQMLYRIGTEFRWEGRMFDTLIVSPGDIEEHLAKGWFLTHVQAIDAHDLAIQEQAKRDDSPPTREELEQKAKELGLKFDGRTTDAKLAKMIEEAIK